MLPAATFSRASFYDKFLVFVCQVYLCCAQCYLRFRLVSIVVVVVVHLVIQWQAKYKRHRDQGLGSEAGQGSVTQGVPFFGKAFFSTDCCLHAAVVPLKKFRCDLRVCFGDQAYRLDWLSTYTPPCELGWGTLFLDDVVCCRSDFSMGAAWPYSL